MDDAPTDDLRERPAPSGTTTERWREDLVLSLRLADVHGTVIGDALRVVEEHCEQAGQAPQEAFGAAEEYARELVASLPPTAFVRTPWHRPAVVAAATTSGTLLLLAGVTGLADGADASLQASDLAVVAVVVAAALVVRRLMTQMVKRVWPVALALFAGLASAVALSVLVPGELVTMPAGLALGLGAVLLTATAAVLAGDLRAHADPVVDPVTGVDRRPVPRLVLLALLAPVVLLVVGLLVASGLGRP